LKSLWWQNVPFVLSNARYVCTKSNLPVVINDFSGLTWGGTQCHARKKKNVPFIPLLALYFSELYTSMISFAYVLGC
jgi:hypothetical protein